MLQPGPEPGVSAWSGRLGISPPRACDESRIPSHQTPGKCLGMRFAVEPASVQQTADRRESASLRVSDDAFFGRCRSVDYQFIRTIRSRSPVNIVLVSAHHCPLPNDRTRDSPATGDASSGTAAMAAFASRTSVLSSMSVRVIAVRPKQHPLPPFEPFPLDHPTTRLLERAHWHRVALPSSPDVFCWHPYATFNSRSIHQTAAAAAVTVAAARR